MKKIICLLTILFCLKTVNISATILRDTLPLVDSADGLIFQNKAKEQATTGGVLLAGGIIMGGVGFGLAMSGLSHLFDPNYHPKDYGSLPEILGFGGLALVVTGVILLIASKRNKRNARIILGNKRLSLPRATFKMKRYTSAGLVINF